MKIGIRIRIALCEMMIIPMMVMFDDDYVWCSIKLLRKHYIYSQKKSETKEDNNNKIPIAFSDFRSFYKYISSEWITKIKRDSNVSKLKEKWKNVHISS